MLVEIIERKLKKHNVTLNKVKTDLVKASQYNHAEDTHVKKNLSKRWNIIDGKRVHRDLYSAFLIMNVNEDLETINKEKCNERYDNFIKLHDEEVDRLFKKPTK